MTRNETRLKKAYRHYRSDPPTSLSPKQVAEVRGQRTAMRLLWLGPEDMAPAAVFLGSGGALHQRRQLRRGCRRQLPLHGVGAP